VGARTRPDQRAGPGQGEVALAGLTLDTGALIAGERNERTFWAFWSETVARQVVPVIPAAALAQAWRGARQARLAQIVNACIVEPLDEALAKNAGELCAKAKAHEIVDASVVASAARRGDAVLTSDPRDLRRLASHAPGVEIIKL
jgi:predicted nucleic acid-binding protein